MIKKWNPLRIVGIFLPIWCSFIWNKRQKMSVIQCEEEYFWSFFNKVKIRNKFPSRLPYNWKSSSVGYLAAVSFQLINFLGVLEIFVTFLIFYVGICEFSLAFAEDIEQSFYKLNQSVAHSRAGNAQITKKSKPHPKLSEIIEFHGLVVQLSIEKT